MSDFKSIEDLIKEQDSSNSSKINTDINEITGSSLDVNSTIKEDKKQTRKKEKNTIKSEVNINKDSISVNNSQSNTKNNSDKSVSKVEDKSKTKTKSSNSKTATKPNIEINNIEITDNRLIIGTSENKKDVNIFIPENSRYQNTLIIGAKATGKTECLLPKLIEQDLKNKKVGVTVITTKKDMAYTIYSLAKFYKRRDIIILKPSIDNTIDNKLLWNNEYNYDFINEKVIDYKEAIKKKKVVIIDMEILKYKTEGLRTVAMLLLQLQLDLQETDITQRTPHFLYIDDAQYYIPCIEHLAYYGSDYNLGITLFLQSRNQMIIDNVDYSPIIDNNFRNIFLLNSLNPVDIDFYSKKMNDQKNTLDFIGRKFNSILYEIIDNSNFKRTGVVSYNPIEKEIWDEILKMSKNNRSKLLSKKRKVREEEIITIINKENMANSNVSDLISNEDSENIDITENKNNSIAEKAKDIVKEEEKTVKRKLSQKIFNDINKNITYCSDDFVYKFK